MNGKTRSCFKVVRRLLFVIFVNASFHDAKVVIKQEETKCVQFLGNNIYMTANVPALSRNSRAPLGIQTYIFCYKPSVLKFTALKIKY